jgi:hypothetical protein
VFYDDAKWEEFALSDGVDAARVDEYYLGGIQSFRLDAADYETVYKELFQDAVAVGAIVLPPSYVSEDFEFRVNLEDKRPEVRIALLSNPQVEVDLNDSIYDIEGADTMSYCGVALQLMKIAEQVQVLLSAKTP